MNSRNDIDAVLSRLSEVYMRLHPYEQRKLVSIFEKIEEIANLRYQDAEDIRADQLVQISSYLTRKLRDSDPHQADVDAQLLRSLRNNFAHGDPHLTASQLRKYQTTLWRALGRSAAKWDPQELSNFLAYCLGTREIDIDPYKAGPAKIVNLYKATFNALDERVRLRAFHELLMRIFADPKLRRLLELPQGQR